MKFKQLLQDESGATAIEYGLIAALICIGAMAAFQSVGNEVASSFSGVDAKLADANTKAA